MLWVDLDDRYGVGVDGAQCERGEGAAGLPEGVPPEQTNI
jgi:hypothetical protein